MGAYQTRAVTVTAVQNSGDNVDDFSAVGLAFDRVQQCVWDQAEQHWEALPVGSWAVTSDAAPGLVIVLAPSIFALAFEAV